MKDDKSSFADLIDAQQRPDVLGDSSSPFDMSDSNPNYRTVRIDDPVKIKNATEFDFEARIELCVLPSDKEKYEEIMNKILRGEGLLRWEERHFTKEGDFIIAVTYLVKKTKPKKSTDSPPIGIRTSMDG